MDVLPRNPEGNPGWVPSEPRQNRQVAQNGDSHKIPEGDRTRMILDVALDVSTPLCEIMGRYGSDKGHRLINCSPHNYTTIYYSIFKDMQFDPLRIFELGLGSNNVNIPSNMGENGRPGASLHGWREFFPNAKIFGADVDGDILFESDRIKTFYCDQTNKHIIKYMWNEKELEGGFDIIVEDGLHTFDANVCFFDNSIHKLKPGGFYIIEDIATKTLETWKGKIDDWKSKHPELDFYLLQIPCHHNSYDNNLLLIKSRVRAA